MKRLEVLLDQQNIAFACLAEELRRGQRPKLCEGKRQIQEIDARAHASIFTRLTH